MAVIPEQQLLADAIVHQHLVDVQSAGFLYQEHVLLNVIHVVADVIPAVADVIPVQQHLAVVCLL